jgi:hypothetical protein
MTTEHKKLNVYQKLQKCRVELKTLPIKESGNNKFAGYTYMELGDFLPHIVDLCDKHNLCTVISFAELASLTIINSELPTEQIVFFSPMSTASLKGCHEIQNLGAVETYLRRYLYVSAFDIVEHDALDSTQGNDGRKPPERYENGRHEERTIDRTPEPTGDCLTPAQLKMIAGKCKVKKVEESALAAAFKVADIASLKKSQVNDALAWIDGSAQS